MSKSVVLSSLDESLIKHGFEKMSLYQRNQLVVNIGSKTDVDYATLTEGDILNYHKDLKKAVLSDRCEEEIVKGFTSTNGHVYRTNRDDQINMIGQKDAINSLGIEMVDWKTEDLGYISHTSDEWLRQVYAEAFQHKQLLLKKYDGIRSKINNATTHEELVAVKWDEEDTEAAE